MSTPANAPTDEAARLAAIERKIRALYHYGDPPDLVRDIIDNVTALVRGPVPPEEPPKLDDWEPVPNLRAMADRMERMAIEAGVPLAWPTRIIRMDAKLYPAQWWAIVEALRLLADRRTPLPAPMDEAERLAAEIENLDGLIRDMEDYYDGQRPRWWRVDEELHLARDLRAALLRQRGAGK